MPSEEIHSAGDNHESIRVRVPKRVLHFSDGVLEEFSDDEVDNKATEDKNTSSVVDPKTLTWGPWMMYGMWAFGNKTVAACDYVGESLASFFGITTPKYQFEVDEYKRLEKKRKEVEEAKKGWSEPADGTELRTTKDTQPTPTAV